MCDQRERLIGYIYDECEPGERAAVQEHLESCGVCRTEIAALRSVRDDLQAWELPDHESVWRPFAPAPAPSWWNLVPRWAMAAAAGAVLISGAAGGVLAHAMMPHETSIVAAGPAQVSPQVTASDLAAFERRIDARFQEEVAALNGRVRLASSRALPPDVTVMQASYDRQFAELRALTREQTEVIGRIYANMGQNKKSFDIQHALLKDRVVSMATALEQQAQGR